MMTAIMQTPTAQIPLNIPYPMPIHNLNLVQPPPLPQLRPYGLEPAPQQQQQQVTTQIINHHMTSSIQPAPAQPPFIPPWIKSRLDELGITEEMFEDLLKIYESVRDEYIDLTKKVK